MIRRSPLPPRTKPIARGKRPRTKRPGPARRVSVLRDRKYLDWISGLMCVVCVLLDIRGIAIGFDPFRQVIDPAHGPVNGMGSKGPDDGAIPLCRHHHDEQHEIRWPAFEMKYSIDRAAIAAEHYARFKQETGR